MTVRSILVQRPPIAAGTLPETPVLSTGAVHLPLPPAADGRFRRILLLFDGRFRHLHGRFGRVILALDGRFRGLSAVSGRRVCPGLTS